MIEYIGFVAAAFTTLASLPQVIKVLRDRSTKDLSLSMLAIMCVGLLLWLLYGITITDWPLIGANAITLLLWSILLIMKLKNG